MQKSFGVAPIRHDEQTFRAKVHFVILSEAKDLDEILRFAQDDSSSPLQLAKSPAAQLSSPTHLSKLSPENRSLEA
jgi:hypothetical protein